MAIKAKGTGKTPGGRDLVVISKVAPRQGPQPVMPRGLGKRGKLEWHKVWEAGFWLHSEDYHWVEMISRAYDDIDAYRERVVTDGLILKGSLGQPVANPLIQEIRRCESTIRQCLSTIGFSPTDRARLGILETKARTGLEDLIDRQQKR